MYKKLMRGSLFITLMLIISVTLTGCDIDFSKIVSGLKNTLGTVISSVGNIFKKGVEVAKTVVKIAKPAISAVANAIGELTGKKDNIVSKIESGLEKVDSALDKASDFSQKVVDAGEKLKDDKDSAGNTASGTVTVSQTTGSTTGDTDAIATSTAALASQTSPITTTSNNNSENGSARTLEELADKLRKIFGDDAKVEIIGSPTARINTELNTAEENEKLAKEIKAGMDDISKGIDTLIDIYKNQRVEVSKETQEKQKQLLDSLEKCKSELAKIKSNPLDKKSLEKYEALKPKLVQLKSELIAVASSAGFIRETALYAIETIEDKVVDVESMLSKVN